MGRGSLLSPPESPQSSEGFFPSINSYDGKVMLAAIVSLLVVISFVLLLHVYARWLLGQAQQRRRQQSHVFDSTTLHHRHIRTTIYDDTHVDSPMNDLDASVISSLPLFVYKSDLYKTGLDCVICLSCFEEDEMGRNLPKCSHVFHVECIDMWLQSHSCCPICRAPVGPDKATTVINSLATSTPTEETRIQDEAAAPSHHELAVVSTDANSPTENSIHSTTSNSNMENVKDSLPPSADRTLSSLSTLSLPLMLPSTSLGCSLKRMLSRSKSEHNKLFPLTTTVTELIV
ncbi:hypothetical protein MKW98_005147 [Papaver atlanticum]|uniref:RING-type E3 ubiquitin transferase n=1 Tax=Papaver atlanticum TaxID=357466 RepID=A0AAD4RWL2_9MAGN|nr:hypothetical protein MKW98_005147 [Papaver atlanticum]